MPVTHGAHSLSGGYPWGYPERIMMRAAMSGGLRPARRATNPILTLHYRGMKLSPRELEKLVRAPHHRKATHPIAMRPRPCCPRRGRATVSFVQRDPLLPQG